MLKDTCTIAKQFRDQEPGKIEAGNGQASRSSEGRSFTMGVRRHRWRDLRAKSKRDRELLLAGI